MPFRFFAKAPLIACSPVQYWGMDFSNSAGIHREFLGWNGPALREAARRLGTRYRTGNSLDLGRVIIVVPGQRAGRRLQELLAFHAEDEKLRLTPPEVVTEGRLPEMLYTPKLPFANDVVQDLAWAQVVRDLPADQRHHLVPHPPAADETLRWLELGKVLRRLHTELAADGNDFTAVLNRGPKVVHFNEAARWRTLATLQQRYLELLDGQKLWDIQTARLKAIEFGEICTDCDIILLGTVDLNKTLRQMLDQIAERVTAYIVAPEDLADRFDAHGCLVAEAWSEAMIDLDDNQLCQVDGPEEQAEAVSSWLAEIADRVGNDEVAIGVPDESLVPQLQRQLPQCGVAARWVEGLRLKETAPYRLLSAATQFAARRRYDDLAALLRHPDVEEWLRGTLPVRKPRRTEDGCGVAMSLPAQLDRYYNTCLPSEIRAVRTLPNAPDWPDLAPAIGRLETWLMEASTSQPLRMWRILLRDLLGAIYGERTLRVDQPADEFLHRSLLRLLQECDRLDSVPPALDTASLSATDAFQIALGPCADEALPPPADPNAVEILGWLELPLDDSRALAVTSFNEGFVPKSTGADAFLPDRLRRELDLLHNERRYARDAYAAKALAHSRKELRVIFARRDTNKDPLQPSRLLFACSEDKLVARARRFFGKDTSAAAPRRLLLAKGTIPAESRFKIPPVERKKRPQRIPVTHFKAYLACPYRYYLSHVLNLEAIDDAARELDGRAFGILLHRVLSSFGRAPADLRDSDHAERIFDYLSEQLTAYAAARYGSEQRRPAIRLQLELARQRLRAFATCQAAEVRDGWRILFVEDEEMKLDFSADFLIAEETVSVVGRIDRIDYHEISRTIRILDYKTADKCDTPDATHRRNADWIDLQLPLYRHLWPREKLDVPADCRLKLGYFNLAKQLEDTKVAVASWDEALLEQADDVAARVMRGIIKGEFNPAKEAPKYSEAFAAICHDNVLGAPGLDDDDDGVQE